MSMHLSNCSSPAIAPCAAASSVLAPFSAVAASGYSVLLTSVDLPEPDTPVTQVNSPTGIAAVTFFRLLPFAPRSTSWRLGSRGVRRAGSGIARRPAR